ncbi:MAG: hypothetical protein HY275_05210 [Gemmatimonadetes bacterium]|nr:hypothetical protein [Gemmatimonadota bacterium]
MSSPTILRGAIVTVLGLALLPLTSRGQSVAGVPSLASEGASAKSATLGEQIENLGRVYSNRDNPVVQEFWLLGRYHGQQHSSDGSTGQYASRFEHRRLRVGFQGKFFSALTLHAQMVSGADLEPVYNGFTELWTQWSFSDALNLTVGQQKHRFTFDRNVSSRYINYLERAMLTNMFTLDYTPAVTLSGRLGAVNYYTGVFSNATGPDMGNAFTNFNSGFSYIAATTWDLDRRLGTDNASLYLSYLYSEADAQANYMNRFRHGLSAALILTDGSYSLVTEATSGLGGTRGSVHGINLQPGVFLTNTLQLVGRYQLAAADEAGGIRAQRRYERTVGLNTGDHYQAGYLGFNYYVARHRIKVMSGAEYSTLDGREGWTSSMALRFFFGPQAKGPFPIAQTLPGAW